MRHIRLDILLAQVFADEEGKKLRKRLHRAHKKLAGMPATDRKMQIDNNGPSKWRPIKDRLTRILGKKCWYTEVELIGAPLTMDHYRPSCNYWWLAFDAENYRVSCPWANSPEHNAAHGCAGGKGDKFPLLPPAIAASGKNRLRMENPVLLDPCKSEDCNLVAFQADGRPVLNPASAGNPVAAERVETSKIILNLDHPDFNSKREQLCKDIADDVKAYEDLPVASGGRSAIRARLKTRLGKSAPFSTAARFYVQFHRHLDWVEEILRAA